MWVLDVEQAGAVRISAPAGLLLCNASKLTVCEAPLGGLDAAVSLLLLLSW